MDKKLLFFKTANVDDINTINALVNSAYRGDYSRRGWTTEADLLDGQRVDIEALQDLIATPNSRIELLFAKSPSADTIKGKSVSPLLVGCMHLHSMDDCTYVGMLTVEPTLQNQKLGHYLLARAEEVSLQDFKKNLLRMTVITKRDTLIAWYLRRGFHLTDKKVAFPQNVRNGIPKEELEMVVLEKTLAESR